MHWLRFNHRSLLRVDRGLDRLELAPIIGAPDMFEMDVCDGDGIAANDIAVFAKGESEPLVATTDGVREPQNRRVEIILE